MPRPQRLAGAGPALLLILAALLSPGVSNCADSALSHQPDGVDTPAEDAARPAASAPRLGPAPEITLDARLRLVLRPVVLGLVPPSDPQGYGECLLRLTAAGPDWLELHYEVKERRSPLLAASTPQLVGVTDTQIRRGELRLDRRRGAPDGLLPLSAWPSGRAELAGGLLWLSAEQLTALRASGRLAWGAGELELTAPSARYPCVVNGRECLLPALRARDAAAEYWILDNAENPLVLKVSGLSQPPGAEPKPAPAAAETQRRAGPEADEALGLINPGASRRPAERPQDTAAPGGGAEAQPHGIGTGFAVVEINF